jgi:hypothetical protein
VKAGPTKRQQSGSFSIDSLKSHEKKSFSTNPVELNKSNLVGHWHYESGAKPHARHTCWASSARLSRRPAVRRVRQSFDPFKRKGGLVCHPARKSRDLLLSPRLRKGRNSKRCLGCARHDRTGVKAERRIHWWDCRWRQRLNFVSSVTGCATMSHYINNK